MNTEEKISQLERQVEELLNWKRQKEIQQISFPLDEASREIIHRDIPVWNGIIVENGIDYPGAICSLNGKTWAFQIADPSIYE